MTVVSKRKMAFTNPSQLGCGVRSEREDGTGPTYDAATNISFLRVILLWLGLQWGIISVLMGYSNYPFE